MREILERLSNQELADRVAIIKDRALGDAAMVEMEFGPFTTPQDDSNDTAEILDEVMRRLTERVGRSNP